MAICFSKLENPQIRHQTTRKVGCHPGDCRWLINFPKGCVRMHGFTYSLYHPPGYHNEERLVLSRHMNRYKDRATVTGNTMYML